MNTRSIENFINEILYKANFTRAIQDTKYDIYQVQQGEKGDRTDLNNLQIDLNRYQKGEKKYNALRSDIEQAFIQFNIAAKKCATFEILLQYAVNINLLQATNVRNAIYNELFKARNDTKKYSDEIQKLIEENLTLLVKPDHFHNTREYHMGELLDEFGYKPSEISFELQKQTEKKLENNLNNLEIDVEQLKKVDIIERIIQKRKLSKDTNLIDVQMIYPLEVGNYKSEQIFSNVFNNLKKIQYLHQEHKLSITEEQYNNIVTNYIKIIELYQDIQLIINIQKSFASASANKHFEALNKIVEKAHIEIANIYDKINKYISKIDKDNIFDHIVDKVVDEVTNVVRTIEDVKKDLEKKEKEQEKTKIDPKLSEKTDTISVLDNYRQQIFAIEQNKELMKRRRILQAEYAKFRDNKFVEANIPFVKFLEIHYPSEIELIKSEKIREQQIEFVYQLWQKSGKYTSFGHYAENIQGIHVDHPEDYMKEDDFGRYDITDKLGVNYVKTKKEAIENLRKRFNEKNPLWKFMNKKLNPDRLDFDKMTVEEINNTISKRR